MVSFMKLSRYLYGGANLHDFNRHEHTLVTENLCLGIVKFQFQQTDSQKYLDL
jgi:hypothetical protein